MLGDAEREVVLLSLRVAALAVAVSLAPGILLGWLLARWQHPARALLQALVMLPEIALTGDFLARVEARFGARPPEWHSGTGGTHRRRVWEGAASGAVRLVVGARSALFLPFRDLGLIVVDEEHDGSYKQEDGALYHARDMAVLRASIEGAAIVAGHAVQPGIARVEMRLEHLHGAARDDTAAHAPNELLALSAEHHAGDDFDGSGTGGVGHRARIDPGRSVGGGKRDRRRRSRTGVRRSSLRVEKGRGGTGRGQEKARHLAVFRAMTPYSGAP